MLDNILIASDDLVDRRNRVAAPMRAAEPFDELAAVDFGAAVRKLRQDAQVTVRSLPATLRFLQHQASDRVTETRSGSLTKFRDIQSPIEAAKLTGFAEKLTCTKLEMVKFQIRKNNDARQWHVDNHKSALTCVATLHGEGTHYISPDTASQWFDKTDRGRLQPKTTTRRADQIERAKPGEMMFFAAQGLHQPDIAPLVHRAPFGDNPDRVVMVARWRGQPAGGMARSERPNRKPVDSEPSAGLPDPGEAQGVICRTKDQVSPR